MATKVVAIELISSTGELFNLVLDVENVQAAKLAVGRAVAGGAQLTGTRQFMTTKLDGSFERYNPRKVAPELPLAPRFGGGAYFTRAID